MRDRQGRRGRAGAGRVHAAGDRVRARAGGGHVEQGVEQRRGQGRQGGEYLL